MANNDDTTEDATHWVQAAQRHYDPDGLEELTTAIVYAIAEARGVQPREVRSPPLYECIDVPALEATFFGPVSPSEDGQEVTFPYADYRVTVRSDGWIRVYEPEPSEQSSDA